MKVEVKEVEKKEAFIPVKFVVIVESEKELRSLYHRLGMSNDHVAEHQGIPCEKIAGTWDVTFYRAVNDVMAERNISSQ